MNMPKLFGSAARVGMPNTHMAYIGEEDLERSGYLDEIMTARFGGHAENWSLPVREFERMRDNELAHISLLGQLM